MEYNLRYCYHHPVTGLVTLAKQLSPLELYQNGRGGYYIYQLSSGERVVRHKHSFESLNSKD